MNIAANILTGLIALACIALAGWMVFEHREGWGWFLFVGFLCAGGIAFKK